jgi:hypothetical protein
MSEQVREQVSAEVCQLKSMYAVQRERNTKVSK